MKTLYASDLSLKEVHRLFGFQRRYNNSFIPLLSLKPTTESEQQELIQIAKDFDYYLIEGKVAEGQVKILTVAPLLRLAGFYRYPIQMTLEESIAEINIEDEDTKITGRIDLLAVNKAQRIGKNALFWVLIVETKNNKAAPSAGLPQLLAYAHESLKIQPAVWGLITNGELYQFVYIEGGNTPTYQLMPFLNLMETESGIKILQVLKAISK
ncbi:MAG: restriction endonuclease subunit R [Symploca sp. SIO2E6]|nr:restriction endonuclease subunit R [Symploca sp. SIO2E6]